MYMVLLFPWCIVTNLTILEVLYTCTNVNKLVCIGTDGPFPGWPELNPASITWKNLNKRVKTILSLAIRKVLD